MKLSTSRFGQIKIEVDEVIRFPQGLLGLEDCRRWVLLPDSENAAVGWLQSLERSEVALAVVSPRRFVPSYRMRVARRELAWLELDDVSEAKVLVVVGKADRAITLNLKATLLINVERRLGRQVITNGDLPIRYRLCSEQRATLRRSA